MNATQPDIHQSSAPELLAMHALALDPNATQNANATGYLTRWLLSSAIPRTKLQGDEQYAYKNGMIAMRAFPPGVPSGSVPRLVMHWMAGMIQGYPRNGELALSDAFHHFAEQCQLEEADLQDQILRMLCAPASCTINNNHMFQTLQWTIIESGEMHSNDHGELKLWPSRIVASNVLFEEAKRYPILYDTSVFHSLSHSPTAIDLYGWLLYAQAWLTQPYTLAPESVEIMYGKNLTQVFNEVAENFPGLDVTLDQSGMHICPM